MEELEKVDSNKVTIRLKGKEREIKFGFSAWAVIEKEYNGIQNIDKMQKDIEERPFELLPHLLYIGLVDKEGLDEETLLDEYGLTDIEMISEKFAQALYGSLPQDEAQDDEKKGEVEAN